VRNDDPAQDDPAQDSTAQDQVAATAEGREWLTALRADPVHALLAFDFDGTMSPIVDDPEQAVAHPAASGLLASLARRVGHIAIVTGRPAGVAASRLTLDSRTLDRVEGAGEVVVLGHYGLQRWDSATGEVTTADAHPGVQRVRRELPAVLAEAGAADAYVEDKGEAVAVHTRRMDDPAGALQRLLAPLTALAAENGLIVEPGRLVLELRPPGVDKGGALRRLVEQTGARSVAFAGDDLGDLPAFAAIEDLRSTGVRGLRVCSGSTEVPALADRADLVVDGPDGVMDWLRWLVGLLPDRADRQ
jgi:trehalose 6-phosphate phosphatase